MQQHVANYADDFHLSWEGVTEHELCKAVREAAEVLHLQEAHHFQLNLSKSAVILRVEGPRKHGFHKQYVAKRCDGVYLKCAAREGQVFRVPMVKSWGYLGAIIGYGNFQRDTLTRRLTAAEHAFQRLKPVLGSRRVVPLKHRVQVYNACVMSTLQYAIFASGFGAGEVARIHGMIMKHLRYIAGSPRHITHERNDCLCHRLGQSLPAVELYNVWERKCRAWRARLIGLTTEDILHLTPCYPAFPELTHCPLPGTTPSASLGEMADQFSCRFCERLFATSQARNTHESRVHRSQVQAHRDLAESFDPARDAVPGTWQCAHCLIQFKRRLNLSRHIAQGACRRFDPSRQPARAPHIARDSLSRAILAQGIDVVCSDPQVCRELTQACCICGRRMEHAWRISQHIQSCHPPVFTAIKHDWARLQGRCKGYHAAASCPFCGAKVQSFANHACPVLCQAACLQVCARKGITTLSQANASQTAAPPDRGEATAEAAGHVAEQDMAGMAPAGGTNHVPCWGRKREGARTKSATFAVPRIRRGRPARLGVSGHFISTSTVRWPPPPAWNLLPSKARFPV